VADYEKSDMSVRGVSWFGVGIAGTMLLSGFAIWVGLRVLDHVTPNGMAHDTRSPHGGPPAFTAQGSGPWLQTDSSADLARFRAEEEAKLTTYGWVDRKAGLVRIPVQRAMELMAEPAGQKPKP
jgi:hypothetical protein